MNTQKRKDIIEYVGKTCKERVWSAYKPLTPSDVGMCTTFYTWAENGAALAIDRLEELCKPSESLVKEIRGVLYDKLTRARSVSPTKPIISADNIEECIQEIAKLIQPEPNAELLEALDELDKIRNNYEVSADGCYFIPLHVIDGFIINKRNSI
jgi:hypothetical protein